MTRRKQPHADSYLSLFSGAGGLDLGFERAGFHPMGSVEIDSHCVRTLRHNCPTWPVLEADVREYEPSADTRPEVLLAGFPCQGFSLGGNRRPDDERNDLFREVVRVTKAVSPTAVVVENVLNLRTMKHPITGRPFVEEIAHAFVDLGYDVHHGIFRVCDYGVPQTRRRFLFIAFRDGAPAGYSLPQPTGLATIRDALFDLANGPAVDLPNHDPQWGFKSAVHVETGAAFAKEEMVVPVRFSRTASDGNPIRSFKAAHTIHTEAFSAILSFLEIPDIPHHIRKRGYLYSAADNLHRSKLIHKMQHMIHLGVYIGLVVADHAKPHLGLLPLVVISNLCDGYVEFILCALDDAA